MLKVKELSQEDHMIFVIRRMSCKCVRSITNGSGPHAKNMVLFLVTLFQDLIDSYVF